MKGLHSDFWVNIANADAGPLRNVKSQYGAATYDPETGAREVFVHSYLTIPGVSLIQFSPNRDFWALAGDYDVYDAYIPEIYETYSAELEDRIVLVSTKPIPNHEDLMTSLVQAMSEVPLAHQSSNRFRVFAQYFGL